MGKVITNHAIPRAITIAPNHPTTDTFPIASLNPGAPFARIKVADKGNAPNT
jgi:hypothetical protein